MFIFKIESAVMLFHSLIEKVYLDWSSNGVTLEKQSIKRNRFYKDEFLKFSIVE